MRSAAAVLHCGPTIISLLRWRCSDPQGSSASAFTPKWPPSQFSTPLLCFKSDSRFRRIRQLSARTISSSVTAVRLLCSPRRQLLFTPPSYPGHRCLLPPGYGLLSPPAVTITRGRRLQARPRQPRKAVPGVAITSLLLPKGARHLPTPPCQLTARQLRPGSRIFEDGLGYSTEL